MAGSPKISEEGMQIERQQKQRLSSLAVETCTMGKYSYRNMMNKIQAGKHRSCYYTEGKKYRHLQLSISTTAEQDPANATFAMQLPTTIQYMQKNRTVKEMKHEKVPQQTI